MLGEVQALWIKSTKGKDMRSWDEWRLHAWVINWRDRAAAAGESKELKASLLITVEKRGNMR
jgi:hypothetical protein